MANPPITIGPFANVPAPGSPIRSDWTQQISHHVVDFWSWTTGTKVTITGNVDAAAAALTDWLAVALNVPAWATRCLVTTTIAGLAEQGQGGNIWQLETRIGQVGGTIVTVPQFIAVDQRSTMSWTSLFEGLAPGASTIAVMARRAFGNGVLRVDAASSCQFGLTFTP